MNLRSRKNLKPLINFRYRTTMSTMTNDWMVAGAVVSIFILIVALVLPGADSYPYVCDLKQF